MWNNRKISFLTPSTHMKQHGKLGFTISKSLSLIVASLCLAFAEQCYAQFHTNVITTPGGVLAFSVDGSPPSNPGPTINLTAGVTNILQMNTTPGFHPVIITTDPSPFTLANEYGGASPQNITTGPVALITPASGFPPKLYYMCSVHWFFGEIDLTGVVGPMPDPNQILSIQVGTNIVMTSSGTNTTWLLIPEFNSNVVGGVWAPVPNYTNTFANGTNVTVFDRLDPICGPNVFLRLRQHQN
ncbi:MAG TPA: hypothetical protein VER98_02405 [Terriglobia bacterium]|nr:hypothetical protein [Terriglobia bacterium]